MKYHLRCNSCGAEYESSYASQICEKCSGILEVIYDGKLHFPSNAMSFWDYEGLMPSGSYKHFMLSPTPLVKESNQAYIKLETVNPTHSFKDRGSVIEVAKASEYGFNEIVCASTGNMAYSVAYYAKLFGIKAKIFVSEGVTRDKARYIRDTHDANVTRVNGDFTEAQRHAINYSKRMKAFLTGDYCYRKEGQKTLGYELLGKGISNIIMPIGNATLFTAVYKAAKEALASKFIKYLPALYGVEASGCAPIANAIKANARIKYIKPNTKADAIAVGFPTYGEEAIAIIKEKGGIFTVNDSELAAMQKKFLYKYGITSELGGIAAYAAYSNNHFGATTAIVITGANI
ncbi:MAG: pyridoxal-phosphate dependent enzyme [Candidatus Micrarchaeaceae archaeon]